jgi:hypothetical protein
LSAYCFAFEAAPGYFPAKEQVAGPRLDILFSNQTKTGRTHCCKFVRFPFSAEEKSIVFFVSD